MQIQIVLIIYISSEFDCSKGIQKNLKILKKSKRFKEIQRDSKRF